MVHIKCQGLITLKKKNKIINKNRISPATSFAWHFKG